MLSKCKHALIIMNKMIKQFIHGILTYNNLEATNYKKNRFFSLSFIRKMY